LPPWFNVVTFHVPMLYWRALRGVSSRDTPPRRSEWGSSLSPERFISRRSISHISVFGERLSRKSCNVVSFPFAFYIAVQQRLKPLWSRLVLCDYVPSTVLCFMSLLMSLLPTSGEFVSEFPSPRIVLGFFPSPWPYWLGWPCQELKLPPASFSGSWGVLGPPSTSRWQPFGREVCCTSSKYPSKVYQQLSLTFAGLSMMY
jgi:hypothetical protein